jgi:hypothetical protein
MAKDPVGQVAAITVDQASRSGRWPLYGTGTAQGYTDEEGEVDVLLDGPPSTSPDEDDTSADANQPVKASVICGSVALGEKVRTVYTPDGSVFVVGSMGGQPKVIGAALIEGGNTDIAVVSTTPEAITDLRAEVTIQHPGHLIRIDTNIFLQSGGASNILTGRVRREDETGATVEVGRFLRSSAMGLNQTIMAGVPCFDYAPDPGAYVYWPSVAADVGGWSIILDPASTPLVAAALVVTDCGALPPAFAIT